MARVLGEALVRVRPDASGFGNELGQEIEGGSVSTGVKRSGSKLGHALGGALKVGALAVTAAAGAALGTALTKGFQRLNAIDQARAKLTGLGHDTREVDKIMANALASVKGTAFGLDEAATVSASAVAAGIKPGRELTKTLKLVADAATIGGTSMGDMGAIFNKVATSNKVQGDVINQLNDKGIPIVQLLGKSMHKTADEVMDMSRKGQIGFSDFQKAMQRGVGGAALKSGNTFTGAYKNMMASVGRIGAGLMGGIFPHLAPAIQQMTKAMGPAEDVAGKIGDKIGKVLGPALENVVPWVGRLSSHLWLMAGSTNSVAGGSSKLGDSFSKIGASIKGIDWGQIGTAFGKGTADTVSVFSVVIGFLADHLDLLARALPILISGLLLYKATQAGLNAISIASLPVTAAKVVATFALARANSQLAAQQAIQNGVERVSMLTRARTTVATIASTVASKAAAAASRVWAAGQWLLNAALTANPIGIVVVAIAALVGGFILAYKKSETFRNIVHAALHGVGVAAKWMWDNAIKPAFNGTKVGLSVLGKAFGVWYRGVQTYIHAVGAVAKWLWNNAIAPAFRFITRGVAALLHTFAGMLRVLSHIPKFDWAKGAAKAMDAAAGKASRLAGAIKNIPDHKNATVTTTYVTVHKTQVRTGGAGGGMVARAAGGPVWPGQVFLVGEHRPEYLTFDRPGYVHPNRPTLARPDRRALSPAAAGSAGGASLADDIGGAIAKALNGLPLSITVRDQRFDAFLEATADGRIQVQRATDITRARQYTGALG